MLFLGRIQAIVELAGSITKVSLSVLLGEIVPMSLPLVVPVSLDLVLFSIGECDLPDELVFSIYPEDFYHRVDRMHAVFEDAATTLAPDLRANCDPVSSIVSSL